MQICKARTSILSSLVLAPALIVLGSLPASAGTVGLVGGGASGETVNVTTPLGGSITSGPLPSVTLPATGGGPFTASALSANVPGVLSVGLMNVSTSGSFGSAGSVQSSSQTANVNVLGGTATASAVSSQCAINSAGTTTGSSSIANLFVSGVGPTTVSPPANTMIPIPLVGTLVLNEQSSTTGPGGNRSITVNAVHLILTGPVKGDIIIAQSKCVARI